MTTEVSSNLNNIGFGSSLMPVVIIIDKPISPKLIEAAINILVVIFSIYIVYTFPCEINYTYISNLYFN